MRKLTVKERLDLVFETYTFDHLGITVDLHFSMHDLEETDENWHNVIDKWYPVAKEVE